MSEPLNMSFNLSIFQSVCRSDDATSHWSGPLTARSTLRGSHLQLHDGWSCRFFSQWMYLLHYTRRDASHIHLDAIMWRCCARFLYQWFLWRSRSWAGARLYRCTLQHVRLCDCVDGIWQVYFIIAYTWRFIFYLLFCVTGVNHYGCELCNRFWSFLFVILFDY